ncbi:flagellar hook-associated protein FlgL [Sphingomonas sp.]|uniref:flagellar hook-associated protein FlgL n=1 Tax=Sphingomonas sp. TaxID=28214 RepID=UPI002BDE97E0|nr:flagellar hook-associated protein FlgL [Sphingomonas sp.]HWK36802.1 flagellar hook-associated protein FlgL [Sphingomonas sp.]
MRISTSLFYSQANSAMTTLGERAGLLQTQISTQKRLAAPSSDAVAYRQLSSLGRAGADATQNAKNVDLASTLLTASDSALASIEEQLQQARDMAIQANSGTLPADQRNTIATALDAMIEDLLKLVNTPDTNGAPLFGGASGNTAYVQAPDGTISYVGTGTPSAIPIGDGASVRATVTGDEVFSNLTRADGSTTDMFAILQGLSASLHAGSDAGTAIDDIKTALDAIGNARASVGARGARLDLESQRLADAALAREETRSGLEDTDISAAIIELQKTMTVLQATQASFTRLSSLSLFDYLR